MAQHIEKGTNYAYTVERIKELSFRSLRSVSVEFTKRLPVELSSELYTNIQHGVCQLQSEPELNMYIHALGLMHEAKLQYAFEHLSDDFINHQTIDIIDYGCGQAIGTICYADFLRKNGLSQQVRRVVLIEPSEIALKRAALHVSCFFPQAEIVTRLKGFDDLEEDDLCVDEETPTLHIFSNVIDLADDYFDLERFVGLINQCSIGDNHYLFIEPYFDYEEKDERLERFVDLLYAEAYFNKTFLKGMFVEGRDWTCQVTLCKNNQDSSSVEMPIPISEGTFKTRIKELISNGAEYVSGSKIEDVACSINDNIVIVHISLEEPLKGYVLGNDGVSYKIGQTNKIVTSLNAIIKVFIEDEELAPFSNFAFENPQILSCLLKGAVVDILQQEVPKGKEYDNLFSLQKLTNTSNCNVIVNNCVRFKLGDNGEKFADKIANILLGFIDEDTIPIIIKLADKADEDKRYEDALEFYKLAAEANNFEAIYRLGTYYYYGKGVTQDYFESVKCYRRAAEQGNALAQCDLGYCIGTGKGVAQDFVEAVKWYRKAAEQGNATAQYNLGICYEKGKGVAKNLYDSVKWYRKAAEQGHANAQYCLGLCYEEGIGVTQNEDEAIKWYMAAEKQGLKSAKERLENYSTPPFSYRREWLVKVAKLGYAKAQCDLANSIEYDFNLRFFSRLNAGKFTFSKKNEKEYHAIFELYYKSAEQNYAEGQCGLASCYLQGKGIERNFSEAVKWYRKAAEQDNNTAKLALFELYALGKGAEKSMTDAVSWLNRYKWEDSKISSKGEELYSIGYKFYYGLDVVRSYDEAAMWWRMAADENNHDAEFMLGVCYEKGLGVEQSYQEAFDLFLKAAKQGNVKAQNAVGICYEKGQGVERSYEVAAEWYSMAAEQKNEEAMCNLGNCYRYGRGVKRSYNEAVKWYKESGTKDAQTALNEIYSKNLLHRWLKIIQFRFGSLK